jgi:hypothetical protein
VQVLYESMLVMFLMTQLPPPPKIELDDDKGKIEVKRRIYGSALVPSFEGLVLFKEQLASSQNALAVILCVLSACAYQCAVKFCACEAITVYSHDLRKTARRQTCVDAPLNCVDVA